MAKLSKTKEYAIQHLYSQNYSAEDIAKELRVPLAQVTKLIHKTQKPKTAPAKTDKTKNLMIRQTSAKKQNTVSIMTEAAAQLSDEFVKNIDLHNKRTEGYIFRPKN